MKVQCAQKGCFGGFCDNGCLQDHMEDNLWASFVFEAELRQIKLEG